MMVSQGGTGAGTSAPSVRKIYEALYGITGSTIDPAKSVLVGGAPATKLPTVRADGTPVYPGMPTTVQIAKPAGASPAATATSGSGPTPGPTSTGFLAAPLLLGGGLLGRRARRRRRPRAPDVRLWSS